MVIMENPIKMDDLGYHYFWKHPHVFLLNHGVPLHSKTVFFPTWPMRPWWSELPAQKWTATYAWYQTSQSKSPPIVLIYIYIPGTEMTLVLIAKDLVLETSTTKIEDKQVPGVYIYIYIYLHHPLIYCCVENEPYCNLKQACCLCSFCNMYPMPHP